MNYQDFIGQKRHSGDDLGFKPIWLSDKLFDFQRFLCDWSIRKGRGAIYADCGLGKTILQLVWAENVLRKENKPILILTPLAVTHQTIKEGEKFGIECHRSTDGKVRKGINVVNYEKLHYFDPSSFVGVVADESSAIKHFESKRQKGVTDFMRKMKYRLLCTATPAPNDYIELGTSSEALGQMGRMDMLATFFKNEEDSLHPIWWGSKWRIKKHSELIFWRWVCTWARACQKPSDLGFSDNTFQLPPLETTEYSVKNPYYKFGFFPLPAVSLEEQRKERKQTIDIRCEKVAELVKQSKAKHHVSWCHLNSEGDLLAKLLPDSVQVSGSDSDDKKEEAFTAFTQGKIKTLITKPKIGCFGLNWQHCSHMTFFPSHSFEQYYQAVRRSWRFGQKETVKIDVVTSDREQGVLKNLQRKSKAAEEMFSRLVSEMNRSMVVNSEAYGTDKARKPKWL